MCEQGSAEPKGPRNLSRIRPKIDELGPKSSPKPAEAKPKLSGAAPAGRYKSIPIDFGPMWGCFDHDPNIFTAR